MKTPALIAAMMASIVLFAACGGGSNDNADAVPTLAGDAGEITKVLQEFADLRENGTAEELAALFSAQCENQQAASQAAINQWALFKDGFDVEVDGVEVQDLQPETAAVKAQGRLLLEGKDGSEDPLSSPLINMVKEGGAWKIATCGLALPGLDEPIILS